jgi:SAM-dependent methyltransferase
MATQTRHIAKADYGLDAPGVVRGFLLGGLALLLVGALALFWGAPAIGGWLGVLGILLAITGFWYVVTSALMVRSSRIGKLHVRDRMLDALRLRGDERVLDVGCGHGLLLIGAAKRLPRGQAVGLDLWSQVDQGDNRRAATLENARAEGVAERVVVVDGDMRAMPFDDASFDAVVAGLAIHNISSREGRHRAVGEVVRVLRPGGQVALLDFQKTGEYADDLRAAGLREVRRSGLSLAMYPPVRIVTGVKADA